MTLSKSQRLVVFNMFEGRCAYCGCALPEKGWHADHVEPLYRVPKYVVVDGNWKTKYTGESKNPHNDRVDNFFPACRACNIDKTCYPLEDWRQVLEQRVAVLRRNYSAYRHAERFGLVAQIEIKVIFYFEKFRSKLHHERNLCPNQP